MNFTHIALIPRTKCPMFTSEYRTISLCNVLYKIMSEVLANRLKKVSTTKLKKVLTDIVSPNQSAFISERLITNNIMMACEVIHSMKARKKQNKGSMSISSTCQKLITE